MGVETGDVVALSVGTGIGSCVTVEIDSVTIFLELKSFLNLVNIATPMIILNNMIHCTTFFSIINLIIFFIYNKPLTYNAIDNITFLIFSSFTLEYLSVVFIDL